MIRVDSASPGSAAWAPDGVSVAPSDGATRGVATVPVVSADPGAAAAAGDDAPAPDGVAPAVYQPGPAGWGSPDGDGCAHDGGGEDVLEEGVDGDPEWGAAP